MKEKEIFFNHARSSTQKKKVNDQIAKLAEDGNIQL